MAQRNKSTMEADKIHSKTFVVKDLLNTITKIINNRIVFSLLIKLIK